MNYRPIGLDHSEACYSGEWEHMCDECRAEASRDWVTEP